jgi:flavin-dependent dehydrogenase
VTNDGRVIIVGAGPAGMAAAAAVTAHGLVCQVTEARRSGKDKPCGDAFVATAISELSRLGLTDDDFSSIGRRFQSIDLRVAGDSILRLTESEDTGWILPRRLIDQMLRDRIAMVRPIAYGLRVVDLVPRDDGIEVISAFGSQFSSDVVAGVVIANGAHSRLSRCLGLDGDPVPGLSISTYAGMRVDQPWFDFDDHAPMGYCWGFPVSETTANVGVCRLAHGTRHDLERGMQHVRRLLPQHQPVTWRGGVGPIWNGKPATRHDPRGVVTCGDAAGIVDPLTGEGLTAALKTGYAAGSAIAAFLQGDTNALSGYSRQTSNYLAQNYGVCGARALWPLLTQAPVPGGPESPVI